MKYIEFLSKLKRNKLDIFSVRDIENLFSSEKIKTIKNNLSRWAGNGYIYKLKNNLYEFVDVGQEKNIPDVYIANKLYSPSYVSLETALSIYSLIPDIAVQVTSLTTKLTRKFKNKHGVFYYRSCQKRAFTGYKLMLYEGVKVYIADPEKALVDFVYFNIHQRFPMDFDEERFDKDSIKKLNWNKVLQYAGLFNKKTVDTLKTLKDWAKC